MSSCSPSTGRPDRPRTALWLALALWLLALLPARRGRTHLPRPLHEPDHRHLLELPVPADHRLGIDPLRRSARHRQSVLAGLLLQQPAPHRRVDRLLGAGAHGGRDAHAILHGRPGRHFARTRTRRAARPTSATTARRATASITRTGTPTRSSPGSRVLLDFPCLEKGSLDLAYLTEVDPLWADDELTAILNPKRCCSPTRPAKAACAADCVPQPPACRSRACSGAPAARARSTRWVATSPPTSAACRPRR